MSKLTDLRGELDATRQAVAAIFEKGGENIDLTAAQVDEVRALNDKMDDLAKQIEAHQELEAISKRAVQLGELRPHPGHPAPRNTEPAAQPQAAGKSLGQMFIESDAYRGYQRGMASGPMTVLDVGGPDLRATLFQTSAGWAPESLRTGRVVESALRPIQLLDLIPTADTNSAAVVYMEETTATSAAAERAEAAAYAESTLALTQKSVTVRSIGTSLPVTDEQLEDVAQAQSYVDGRLGFFIRQRLDSQVLNGDNVAPNILGILNASGLQTQAKGADPVPDAVYKAMTKVRVTGRAFPSAFVVHPNDWQDVRLLRTADGIYIWGSPAEAGPERIWGLQVVQSDAIVQNTGLVGDFSPAMLQLYIRRGLEVQVGFVNDDFTKGKQTVRAGLRAALVVYRGSAFATCTGI